MGADGARARSVRLQGSGRKIPHRRHAPRERAKRQPHQLAADGHPEERHIAGDRGEDPRMEQGRLGEELVRLPLGSGHRLQQEDAQVLRVPLRKRRRLEVEHRPPCRGRGGRSVRIRRLRRVRRLLARGLDRDRRPRSARPSPSATSPSASETASGASPSRTASTRASSTTRRGGSGCRTARGREESSCSRSTSAPDSATAA